VVGSFCTEVFSIEFFFLRAFCVMIFVLLEGMNKIMRHDGQHLRAIRKL
jgi:uncharacterized membrane protein